MPQRISCNLVEMSSTSEKQKPKFVVPIELLVCFLFFCLAFADTITSNLLIFRSCYVILGYNKSECELMGSDKSDNMTSNLEKLSQPYANEVATVRRFTTGTANAIVCLFVGTWSDKYGRKPVMVVAFAGYAVYFAVLAIISLFSELSPWFFLLVDIPIQITGGYFSLLIATYGYMSDLTRPENRAFRFALMSVAQQIGPAVGALAAPYIFEATGYLVVYLIATSVLVITTLLCAFFIPESLEIEKKEKLSKTILEMFHTGNVKSMLKTAFKRRPNYVRSVILTVTITGGIATTTQMGQLTTLAYFLRAKFGWTLKHVSIYGATTLLANAFAILTAIPIMQKVLKLPDYIILVCSGLTCFCAHIVLGLAPNDAAVYIGTALNSFTEIGPTMLKSIISKVVPIHELGKLFSVYSTCDSLISLGASPMYTAIYNLTIETNPGLFNFVTVGLTGLLILLSICIGIILKFKMVKNENGDEVSKLEDE